MFQRFWLTLSLGVKSLLLHKLRSGLAILGILIGVTAVIWLVAMGEGVSHQAELQIEQLGATSIIVRSIKPPQGSSSDSGGLFLKYGLLREDYDRIVNTLPSIRSIARIREMRREVRFAERSCDVTLVGCEPTYLTQNHLELTTGSRFLQDEDSENYANVCVIGHGVAQVLFPLEDPIGKSIQVDKDFYTVVGRTKFREASGAVGGSFSGKDYNLDIYVPLETVRQRIGDQVITARGGSVEGEIVQLSQITLDVDNKDKVMETADIVRSLLESNHKLADYSIVVPQELLQQAMVLRVMFNVLLVLIAGIALLVGGIGIMNIMLATVTERTREIGIRRALGAKQRDIIEQFLAETIVLSASGGILGVILGFMCGPAVWFARSLIGLASPDFLESLPKHVRDLEPRIAMWSIAAAFLISLAEGIVFGLYPARRAARMDPIEALRHE